METRGLTTSFLNPRAGLLALVIFASAATLAAQTPASAQTLSGPRTVKLNLIVTDESNESVTDFNKEDLQLLEDDIPQTLTLFEKDNRPLRIVVAIDTSGSFKGLIAPVLEGTRILINSNRDSDETMLLRFISSDKIETVEKFTSDKAKLVGALPKFVIEGGQSAVIDALYLAVQAVAEYKSSDHSARRAVLLFSDGEDRASYYKSDELLKLLRASDVQVFVVGIIFQLEEYRSLTRPSPKEKARKLLEMVASETGGRVFFPANVRGLAEALTAINKDLQTQFLIGYESTNQDAKKNFRKVKVKIIRATGKKPTAITRSGYFLNPPDGDKKKKK